MTDFTTAAAAFLILTGQVPSAPPPPGVAPIVICQLPNPPPIHCESGWDHDCNTWASSQNHIVVRWAGDHPQPVRHDHLSVIPPRHEEGRPGFHPRPPYHRHHHHRHDPGLIE